MFGILKNVFGNRPSSKAPALEAVAPKPASPAPVQPPAAAPARPVAAPRSADPMRTGGALPRFKGRMERLLLNLKSITEKFPPELQKFIAQQPANGVIVAVSVEAVVEQLASGRVEISFGDLRRISPIHIFSQDSSRDMERVEIPLAEILPKLDPTLLTRRSHRAVELPDDVEGVFESKLGGGEVAPVEFRPAATPEPAPVSIPKPDPIPAPALALDPFPAPAPDQGAIPASEPVLISAPQFAQIGIPEDRKALIDAPISASRDLQEMFGISARSVAPPPEGDTSVSVPPVTETVPEPMPTLRLESQGGAGMESPELKLASPSQVPEQEPPMHEPVAPEPVREAAPPPARPASASAPASRTVPVQPSMPAPSEPVAGTEPSPVVIVLLNQVSAGWPEAIREEVAGCPPDTVIEFPTQELGVALRRGIVSFPWGKLREWIVPPLKTPTFFDVAVPEIPVSVVAPLFMAASRGAAPVRARVQVDESIPLPFAPEPKKAAPEPLSAPVPVIAPAPSAETSAGALGLDGRIPSEIVDRACTFNGVAGAIIALQEGVLVAAKLPPELQSETLAAFLPQVFTRVEQATTPMQIGELKNVTFTAGDRSWQIWKAGIVFFAALGRPNELLPASQLKLLASQLARQVKA